VQHDRSMTITLGTLINALYTEAEHRFHDHELSAMATQAAVAELMSSERRDRTATTPATPRALRRVP
jgi:hypothetical protein